MRKIITCVTMSLSIVLLASIGFAQTAEEIMEAVKKNIQGPPGMAAIASGKMKTPAEESDIRILHYVDPKGVAEVFQTELYKIRSSGDANLKHKITWRQCNENGIPKELLKMSSGTVMYIFSPALRRERIIPDETLDGIERGQYPYALLVFFGVLDEFEYLTLEPKGDKLLIRAQRKKNYCFSPFPEAVFTIGMYNGIPVIEEAFYTTDRDYTITQILQDYQPVTGAPGHVAFRKAIVGNSSFSFERWGITSSPAWVFSHTNMGIQKIPKP